MEASERAEVVHYRKQKAAGEARESNGNLKEDPGRPPKVTPRADETIVETKWAHTNGEIREVTDY